MSAKNIVTVGLLLFVGASVLTLAAKALRRPVAAAGEGDGVIAYYFHSNTRCPTCRTIESYAHKAIQAAFADELRDGSLQWRVVNYETSGNEHFATQYGIIAPTVVVVKIEGGEKKWRNLMRVWQLVHDRDAFFKYVQDGVAEYLEKQ